MAYTALRPSEPHSQFAELVSSGQIVFFVGSGVSLSYPACLPSASEFITFAASSYLTGGSPQDRKQICDAIWPEVFYQDLIAFVGDSALSAFGVLGFPDSRPTLAHHLIIRVAASGQVPVITTNYDCLLEKAANQQNTLVDTVQSAGPYVPSRAGVSIWKVHGSIGPTQSALAADLLATVSRITQPNQPLLGALSSLFKNRHVCFVGYSGRDLDLFPMIRCFSNIRAPFWIDPNPSAALIRRADSIGATLISSTLEVAFDTLGLTARADLPSCGIDLQEFHPVAGAERDLRGRIEAELSRHRNEQLRCYPLGKAQQALFQAICLRRVGRPAEALNYLKTHYKHLYSELDSEDRALLLNTMARLHDCVSDYRESETCSKAAVRATRWSWQLLQSSKAISLRIQSLHAMSMAQKMQLGPLITYGVPAIDFTPRLPDYGRVLIRYVMAVVEMKILTTLMGGPRNDVRAGIWVLAGWHWYLDHKLILLAFVESITRSPATLRRFARIIILASLRRIMTQASEKGDARVVAHVQKQLQRHGFPSTELQLAFDGYDLATDPLNEALVHRNAGDEYFQQGHMRDAAAEFEKALALASQCQSPATALKALVGLYVTGKALSKDDLSYYTQGISGVGYGEFVDQFRRLLD